MARVQYVLLSSILDSGIDVGQGINIGPGNFFKKKGLVLVVTHYTKNTFTLRAVGPGKKNPKLVNLGPVSIPGFRVNIFVN